MKNMKIKSVLKKHWLIIGLVTLLLSSVGLIVWARYVDANNSMKRTIVSLAETDEKRFTSNLLTRTESPSPKTYPVSNSALEGDYYKMQVIVRNYTPTDTLHFYDSDIAYTFTAELVNVGGTAITNSAKAALVRYGTTGTEFTLTGGKYVVTANNQILNKEPNGTPHDITYTFYFHKDLLDATDNVFVKISATPTNDSIRADVGSLQGIIGISRQATEIVKTWSGTFSDEGAALNDQNSHDVEASAYDGFNYIIQGNGARKVSLTWNNTILELNPFSIDELKSYSDSIDSTAWSQTTSGNYTTIVFKVDSEECPRYDVQFYMKGTEIRTWSAVTGAVTFNPSVTI
ncbi:hypothetical protein [Ruminococcus flavefaciens]|uniref:Uncharacterized protein n=1 Tax=Ruminococcus flavefaciens TaxID=1265 RepID=A0A1K1NBV9_RUMFL|nr:hypothetical protein [Ruminococcus flavefaciens]SFW32796.1 hypothetical protein SAMN02910280_1806 [Ruminococcus flavefaciens]